MNFYDRVKMSLATTGTGTITLGSAQIGFRTLDEAGVTDGEIVSYAIEDGANWETGTGTYTASGTALTRTVLQSSNAGAAIDLSANAVLWLGASASDLADIEARGDAQIARVDAEGAAQVAALDAHELSLESDLTAFEAALEGDLAAAVGAQEYDTKALALADVGTGLAVGDLCKALDEDDADKLKLFRVDAGPVLTERWAYVSSGEIVTTLADLSDDNRRQLIATDNAARSAAYRDRPIALVVVLTGQSNHEAWGPAVSSGFSPNAYMPTLGPCAEAWRFYSFNDSYTVHYADIAGAVEYAHVVNGELTAGGIILSLLDGKVARIYAASVAIGSTAIEGLSSGGKRNNLHAIIRYLCKAARAAGYRPLVACSHSQGETNAFSGTDKAAFKASTIDYIRMFQHLAACEMDDPTWVAPFAIAPIVNFCFSGATPSIGRDILEALYEAAHETPGAFLVPSPGYEMPHNTDRTHKTGVGMLLYGEHEARALRGAVLGGEAPEPLNVVDCWRSLSTPTRVWYRLNMPAVVDLAYDFGTSQAIYPGNKDGLSYSDNGAIIAVTAHVLTGNLGYIDLASAPVGATAEQQFLFGTADMGGALSAATDHMPGTRIRADEDAMLAKWDGATQLRRFLLMRTLTPREVA